MKKYRALFILIIISVFAVAASGLKQDNNQENEKGRSKLFPGRFRTARFYSIPRKTPQQFAPDRILVKFKPVISEQAITAAVQLTNSQILKKINRSNIFLIRIPPESSVGEMVFIYQQNPDVEFAEPDYRTRITTTPNDILFEYQYALFNEGQAIGIPGSPQGKERADIKATAGWEETTGKEEVIIAIVDTGVDLKHPDLINKLYSSGYDFVNDDTEADDDHGHGTHVAGIAAAETDNNEGIAGVAWNCKILPIKVMDSEGEGYYSWMISGIDYAIQQGAEVINLSLGGDAESDTLKNILKTAFENDIVVVASAGNDNSPVLFPAAYDEYCLAVAASDYDDLRPEWSNYGTEVDVAAPGVRILSCIPTWYWGPGSLPYAFSTGTSMSAPHVAGLAALIKGLKNWLSAAEIMNVIRYTSDDINNGEHPGKDEYIGHGRINLEKALVPIKISEK
ncbi:MAG: peptidase S8 [Candidatus Aminicenantes bacterium]|nr:peptidase S8 [Candidatus Aminicenantes bacterium]